MTTQEELFSNIEMGTVITCPVCRDTYNLTQRSPLNIPCGHTVCTQCSTSLLPRSGTPVVMCPVCRKRHLGQSQNGVVTFNFPKNYQLLEVVETVSRLKQQADRKRLAHDKVKCVECETEVSEASCTTCACMRGPSCDQFDFMGRPKNKLICMPCIIKSHSTAPHDAKPIEAVKTASDNHRLMNELKVTFERLKSKTEGAQLSLNNCKEELDSVQKEMNSVMTHITDNPKNTKTFCIVAKFMAKLEELDKTIADIGKVAHRDATNIGAHAKAIKSCIEVAGEPRPQPAEEPFRPRMMVNDMRMAERPQPARLIPNPPRAAPQPPQQAPAVPAPVPEVVREENPRVPDAENVQIFIHMREGGERERHVREAMEQFMDEHPDAIAIGNAPGEARAIQGGRNDERLNGLVRGIFEFVDGVMAGERQQRNVNNRAANNGELLDEVALVEQEVVDGVARQFVRRRVQLRLQVAPPANEEGNAPAEVRPPANVEPDDVEMDVHEAAVEEPEVEELDVEEPAAVPRRRGRRPRGQPAPPQPIARVGARRAAERPIAAENARNARRNRRAAARH